MWRVFETKVRNMHFFLYNYGNEIEWLRNGLKIRLRLPKV